MKKMFSQIVILLLITALMLPFTAMAQDETVEFEAFSSEQFQLQGIIPVGWTEASPGTYLSPEGSLLIIQSAPGMSADDLLNLLQAQLGLSEIPEKAFNYETDAFAWAVYQPPEFTFQGQPIMASIALTEMDDTAYVVVLLSPPDRFESEIEMYGIPVLEAVAPLSASDENVYKDPAGLFTVPIPTNWQLEEKDGYVQLTDPDEQIFIYLMTIESDDIEAAVAEAWQRTLPDFDMEPSEITELPEDKHIEKTLIFSYEDDDEDIAYVATASLYEGVVYIYLHRADIKTGLQRQSQIGIIQSGFEITAIEKDDLTGVEPRPVDEEITAELEDYLVDLMEQMNIPGASVAIVQNGEIVYLNGFGVRDLETGEPVTPDTMIMIGSTTKTMTTLMMAQLVDEGLMNWDTPVTDILPSFTLKDPDVTAQIQMEHLVCACTGVPRRDMEWIFNFNDATAESVVESLADFELFTDFGEAFQYSNQMVATGGFIAAIAAGAEYGNLYEGYTALMQERVFTPIGMETSSFSYEDVYATDNYATPYGKTVANEFVMLSPEIEQSLESIAPAGALWSNAQEMGLYLITELNKGVAPSGERIVSEENLLHTWEPQVDIAATASYGLGWIILDYKGLTMIEHGGNTGGFTSDFAFIPDAGIGIAILTNGRTTNIFNEAVRYRFLELVYDLEPEVDTQIQFTLQQIEESLSEITFSPIPDDMAEPYLDTTWENELLGTISFHKNDEGQVMMDIGEFTMELRLMKTDDDTLVVVYDTPLAGLPLEEEEDESGNTVLVIDLKTDRYVFEKVAN